MNRSPDCLMDAGCLREAGLRKAGLRASGVRASGIRGSCFWAPSVKNSQFSHQQELGVKMRIRRIANTLRLWSERSRQRKELKVLAHHPKVLKDIGVSRYDVQRESRKPFWRA